MKSPKSHQNEWAVFSFLALAPKRFELESWGWSHSTANLILHILSAFEKVSRAILDTNEVHFNIKSPKDDQNE